MKLQLTGAILGLGVLVAGTSVTAFASSCIGTCGTGTANGDVTNPPGFSNYLYVTTSGGPVGGGTLPSTFGPPGVNSTNGSTLTTSPFTTTAGEMINFEFNYITSDGSGYPDYAWAGLMSTDGGTNYLIFSAQTQPTGNTVPGFTMPPLAPGTALVPPSSPITAGSGTQCGSGSCNSPAGGPVWSELADSGYCWAYGCGLTGWIESEFTGEAADTYVLEFGVSNSNDEEYDSGLALNGVEVGGQTVITTTPEPSTVLLMLSGLGSLGYKLRRRKA